MKDIYELNKEYNKDCIADKGLSEAKLSEIIYNNILFTQEYGVPSKGNKEELFIDTVICSQPSILYNKMFSLDTISSMIHTLYSNHSRISPVYSGGKDFYNYLIKNGVNKDNIEELIESYRQDIMGDCDMKKACFDKNKELVHEDENGEYINISMSSTSYDYDAFGKLYESGEVIILKGSRLRPITIKEKYEGVINSIIENRELYLDSNDSLIVNYDTPRFQTVSQAARFVYGFNISGWIAWRDENGNQISIYIKHDEQAADDSEAADDSCEVADDSEAADSCEVADEKEEVLEENIEKSSDSVEAADRSNSTDINNIVYALNRITNKLNNLAFEVSGIHEELTRKNIDEADTCSTDTGLEEHSELDYTIDDFNNANIVLPKESGSLDAIINTLKNKKAIILSGVPGTGKSTLAIELARLIVGKSDTERIETVAFNGNTTYATFVESIIPSVICNKRTIMDGQLKKMVKIANKYKDSNSYCVMIIEEINRAKIGDAFGELFQCLGKRDSAPMLPSGQRLKLPDNLLFIATMNPYDESNINIDKALDRRFGIIDMCPPDSSIAAADFAEHIKPNASTDLKDSIAKAVDIIYSINKELTNSDRGEYNKIGFYSLYEKYDTVEEFRKVIKTYTIHSIELNKKLMYNKDSLSSIDKLIEELRLI